MSDFHLPKSIFITGASSGIGAALARHYATRGVTLILTGRNAQRLEQVSLNCTARGAAVELVEVDVTDKAAMQHCIDIMDEKYPFDLVIANAGISGGTAVGTETLDEVEQIFATNVQGVFNTVLPALARMQARGKGQIGIMSSLAGFRGFPGAPAYCASKAAVKSYGEALRGFVKKDGVHVSVICPGFIETPMTNINGYTMPFIIPAEKAATIIAGGLARNKARIAFPFQAYSLIWFLSLLSPAWTDWLFARLPAKSSAGLTS